MKTSWAQIEQIISGKLSPWQKKVWIEPLHAQVLDEALHIFAPSSYMADFVKARFLGAIKEAIFTMTGEHYPVVIGVSQELNATPSHDTDTNTSCLNYLVSDTSHSLEKAQPRPLSNVPPTPRSLATVQVGLPIPLASSEKREQEWRHSFDDFIVGPCNELAHAASKSMCGSSLSTDVLFLSSSPGLGKTHLMQSVGHSLYGACNRKTPKIEYLTAEEFASSFYLSLKTQQTDKFKARYRGLDLLLLEDVHFLQNKEKMQDELLSTLKSLSSRGAKVVFTSSFMPNDLSQIDEQLYSRFCAGFVASIDRPDKETRKKLFSQKASLYQVLLPEDVEDTLAQYIKSDIRQIESCLHNLILKARLYNSAITMQMAMDVIANYAKHSPIMDLDGVIDFICKGFSISREQLLSSRRKQELVLARNAAYFLLRKHTELSLDAIGKHFNRKHSTVLKGITNLEREMSRQTPRGKQIANTLIMIERNGNLTNNFIVSQ